MKRIRIISVPPGQAPEWVRKEWVGLELPLTEVQPDEDDLLTDVVEGRPERSNDMGYSVEGGIAIEMLGKKSMEAAQWWRNNASHILDSALVFNKEVCKLI